MFNLRDRLILHIDQVLDPENDAPQEPKQGGWGSILQKSFALLTRYRAQNSDSDAALKAKLSDLHGDIKKQIESEVCTLSYVTSFPPVSCKQFCTDNTEF